VFNGSARTDVPNAMFKKLELSREHDLAVLGTAILNNLDVDCTVFQGGFHLMFRT
jgi:hypothetical protein